jgi:hypothetical protein
LEPKHAADSVQYLEHGLALAGRLAAHARVRALALDTLPDLTPPAASVADDQAHLRALASLYLLSQLGGASLLPSVELLAGLSVSGGMQLDLGSASSSLMEFWRHRSERFSANERQHFFDRVFDSEFESLMIDLCEGLYKLDEGALVPGASNPLNQAKVRTMAETLAEHLLNLTHAESEFTANEILAETHAATDILKDPRVEHAFGAHTIWKTVETILRRYGTPVPDFASFVTRGQAGMTILSWLADARGVPQTSTRALVGLDNPVIAAAVDWLQSSLAVEQAKSDDGPPVAAGGSRAAKGA